MRLPKLIALGPQGKAHGAVRLENRQSAGYGPPLRPASRINTRQTDDSNPLSAKLCLQSPASNRLRA